MFSSAMVLRRPNDSNSFFHCPSSDRVCPSVRPNLGLFAVARRSQRCDVEIMYIYSLFCLLSVTFACIMLAFELLLLLVCCSCFCFESSKPTHLPDLITVNLSVKSTGTHRCRLISLQFIHYVEYWNELARAAFKGAVAQGLHN